MQRRTALAALLLPVLLSMATTTSRAATEVQPTPPEVLAEWPNAHMQGGGRFRYFGFRVYDIRLWTGDKRAGNDWAAVPLALVIEYARSFSGAAIAERSLGEMRRQTEITGEQAERWLAAMKKVFPDVNEGDRLTGVQQPGQGARFFFNGKAVGDVNDREFTRLFFGIWLSARTSEPALRDALLGNPP